jgi:NosR/NirI family nitrous oxide reductase transcriptional regulator
VTRRGAAFRGPLGALLVICAIGLGSGFDGLTALELRAEATPLQAWLQPQGASTPAADPWGFESEDTVETWADILRPQALDLAVTTAFIALALIGFFRKSVRLKYVTLALAVAYMGFTKSQLLSVTDIFRVVDLNLPTFKYSVTWYLFAAFTVVSTVLWGRLYCGRICAFGAFTQLMDATIPSRFRIEPPAWLERRAGFVKYGLLAAVVIYYMASRHTNVYRYVEPFWMFTLSATPLLWAMLAALLVATVVVRNLYCRFLCPVGAMLGILSNLTLFKIKRWSECKTCKICEKTCEWGAIQGPRIIKSECVRCDDCERLYMDQKKCPHWLIIIRKGQKAGIPSIAQRV